MNIESNKPLYLQVEADIRNSILQKKYRSGQKLPTENELSEQYKVSKITIRKAMSNLAKDGLVQKVQGKGTFISYKKDKLLLNRSRGFQDSLNDYGHSSKHKILNISLLTADDDIASKLQIAKGTSMFFLERLIWEDVSPIAIDSIYLPEKDFPDFMKYIAEDKSFYQTLQENYGIAPAKSVLEINGIIATKELSELLQCNMGDPLFHIEKIGYQINEQPIHYSITTVRCDRVSYIVSTDNATVMDEKIIK